MNKHSEKNRGKVSIKSSGFLLVFLLQACTLWSPLSEPSLTVQNKWPVVSRGSLEVPSDDYPSTAFWSLVWTKKNEILVFIDMDGLMHLSTNGGEFDIAGLEEVQDYCTRETEYFNPEELPDGRIGWIMNCNSFELPNSSGEDGEWRHLIAFDLSTRVQEQIVPGKLPRIQSYRFSWDPAFETGIVSAGSSEGTLYWVDESGSSPIDLVIGSGDNSWNLVDSYLFEQAEDNPDIGIAGNADWSPDGNAIAFFASVDAIGKTGFARPESMFELYLLDPASMTYTVLLTGIYYPTDLQWSPNSQEIAFVSHSSDEEESLWVFSTTENKAFWVAEGDFREIDWSPDGTKIIGLQCFELICKAPILPIFVLR